MAFAKLRWVVCVLVLGALVACGGDSESGSSSSSAPLPDYDPNATYDGKTASEIAQGLDDLNPMKRARALGLLKKFGVNALPVRDKVQAIAQGDDKEQLRVAAFALLHGMKDPDGPRLMRDALRNPEAVESRRGWNELTKGAVKMVDEATLIADMKALAADNPEHAETLLTAGFTTAPAVRKALAREVMGKEKSDVTVARMMQILPQLGLTEDESIAYIKTNAKRLPNTAVALAGLRSIGGEKAFEAGLELIRSDQTMALRDQARSVASFARHKVGSDLLIGVLAEMGLAPGTSKADRQMVLATIQSLVMGARQRKEGFEEASAAYLAVLERLIGSDSPEARSLAVRSLAAGISSKQIGAAEGLPLLFSRIREDDAEVVVGEALKQLQQTIPRLRDEKLPELPQWLAQAMYARKADDAWADAVANGMFNTVNWAVRGGGVGAAPMIDALDAQARAHAGHPANKKTLQLFMALAASQARNMGPAAPAFAGKVAQLMLDEAITQAELEKIFSGKTSMFLLPGHAPSVETIFAFGEPLVKSGAPKLRGQWTRRALGSTGLLGQGYHYVKDPAEKKKYAEFLNRMITEASPDYRLAAVSGTTFWVHRDRSGKRTAFANFPCELGGATIKVTPTFMTTGQRFGEPAAIEPLAEEGALLINAAKRKSRAGRVFAVVHGLQKEYDVVFVDAQGKVIAVTTLSDPAFVKQHNKRPYYLVHDTAQAVLLIAKGKSSLKAGDQTPLEPEFLGSW